MEDKLRDLSVSIHAPTRGATKIVLCGSHDIALFQSTHPHGVRRLLLYFVLVKLCFNPRTHTGCDPVALSMPFSCSRFNPRTHTGCDERAAIKSERDVLRFNPRTHTGCDILIKSCFTSQNPFQSTHPHGVRLCYPNRITGEQIVSIHAPTRGATKQRNRQGRSIFTGFNPRTHTGCDSVQSYIL